MSDTDKITSIVHGMELYFRTFALADNMSLHEGDIEWIAPQPEATGPAIVFKVSLDERNLKTRLEEIRSDLESGLIPSFWVVSPTSTPATIVAHLQSIGFRDGSDIEHPEPGMALDIAEFTIKHRTGLDIEIRKVKSMSEFGLWIDVVNEALHGWKLLSIEHYTAWLSHTPFTFYLGYYEGRPIATVATIQDGQTASLEFVSTLQRYRHRGAATALCVEGIQDLQLNGVTTVTLRSSSQAVSVYAKLGFRPYYEQVLLSYLHK